MICAKIEQYRATKDAAVLAEIKAAAESDHKALCFLFTVEPDTYKDALIKAATEIAALDKDETGLFVKEEKDQEELLLEVMPVYTLYESKLNKKEHYNELIAMCKAAVKKYPGSNLIFTMLAEVLEYFSEEIFEHYKMVQTLLWEQYVAISAHMTEQTAYALAKGCFYKAFLLEKYEDALAPFNKEEYPLSFYAIKRLDKRFDRV